MAYTVFPTNDGDVVSTDSSVFPTNDGGTSAQSISAISDILQSSTGSKTNVSAIPIDSILPQYQSMYMSGNQEDLKSEDIGRIARAKYDYTKGLVQPLEEQMFGMLPYNNPQLEQQYKNNAYDIINTDFNQERGITSRAQAATGDILSKDISTLQNSILNLGKQESIARAANNIKQRLKDRELQATLGVAPTLQSGVK